MSYPVDPELLALEPRPTLLRIQAVHAAVAEEADAIEAEIATLRAARANELRRCQFKVKAMFTRAELKAWAQVLHFLRLAALDWLVVLALVCLAASARSHSCELGQSTLGPRLGK